MRTVLVAGVACATLVVSACTSEPSRDRSPSAAGRITPPGVTTPAEIRPTPVAVVTEPAATPLESACALPLEFLRRIQRGYYPGRSPDVMVVPREPNFFGGFESTSHSGPWDYLQDVPVVLYGPGFIRRTGPVTLEREVTVADIAPTLAELLRTSPPPEAVGRPLTEVLVPRPERPVPPRLIVTIVWDGGGWNVLNAWPDSWPELRRLIARGASVRATVGSSPSVTPAVHTTLGTGAYPNRHGIIGIEMRVEDGSVGVGAFRHRSPEFLKAPTLADVYDRATRNTAQVGMFAYKSWHLGMVGHGAEFPGGDADIAIVSNQNENPVTNPAYYTVPGYVAGVPGLASSLRIVDLDDGELDDTWMEHQVLDDPTERRDTPAWVLYQTRIIKEIIRREGFGTDEVGDLFYTNYKQIDEVGHNWNLVNEEMREIVEYSDAAVGKLVKFLNGTVGRNRWVMVVTADHGQGPDPRSVGAWPINMGELVADIGRRFDVAPAELVANTSPVGFWLDPGGGATAEEVARFLLDYRLEDNVENRNTVEDQYRRRLQEPIFEAAFVSETLGKAWQCARA
jgi:arylsulfatase A-like enzyme